jgi:hypothetical protein
MAATALVVVLVLVLVRIAEVDEYFRADGETKGEYVGPLADELRSRFRHSFINGTRRGGWNGMGR